MAKWEDIKHGLDIGGRATDLNQIGLSILHELNNQYPNGIPTPIRNRLFAVAKALEDAEASLQGFARFMIEESNKR